MASLSRSRSSSSRCGTRSRRYQRWEHSIAHRTDYWNDPDALTPNSLLPGGSALILDEIGRVLMQRRSDSGNWSLPGVVMELGETIGQAVVREVHEETGLEVELTGILGVYTDPRHIIAYDDGEVRQEFVIAFNARPVGGELRPSDESIEVLPQRRLLAARRAGPDPPDRRGPESDLKHSSAARTRTWTMTSKASRAAITLRPTACASSLANA